MKKSFMRLFVLMMAIALAGPAFSAGRKSSFSKTKQTAPEYHDTVIASVAPTSITITEDKASKTYSVTQFTEVTVKGQRAALADLKPGMAVSVTTTDGTSATRIAGGDPPAQPSK